MTIKKYQKQGKTFYKFQIRLGKRVTTRSGFKSKPQAMYAYTQLLEDYENDIQSNVPYKEVYEDWLVMYETTVKETTYTKTTGIFRNHILPFFGDKRIGDIVPKDCEYFALKYKDYVKGDIFYRYASKIMDYAKIHYNLKENPFKDAMLPAFKKPAKKIDYLEADEAAQVIDYYKDNTYWKTFFRLMIYTGARRGEALALEWTDIDFKNKTLTINKSLGVNREQKVFLTTTKTDNSERTIDLDNTTLLYLKELKLQSKSKIVFPNTKGEYQRLSTASDMLKKALSDLGLKEIRLHDLRHTHASLLFASGANIKYVQHRLGHAKIETTLNIYAHVTKDTKKKDLSNFVEYMENKA